MQNCLVVICDSRNPVASAARDSCFRGSDGDEAFFDTLEGGNRRLHEAKGKGERRRGKGSGSGVRGQAPPRRRTEKLEHRLDIARRRSRRGNPPATEAGGTGSTLRGEKNRSFPRYFRHSRAISVIPAKAGIHGFNR